MAQRRIWQADRPPAELVEFSPAEWAAPADDSWWPGFERWRVARDTWVAEHPGSLGDAVEMLQCRVWTRRRMARRYGKTLPSNNE